MERALSEKENIISNLVETNNELETYVKNIEKQLNMPKEYQGQTVSESKNKYRSIKSFMSRAEVALWFSKSFGLEIQSLHVKESSTNIKHVLKLSNCECQTENTGTNKSKYSTLSDNERKNIEEILYLLDKFCVGECFYHELSMMDKALPRTYLIKQIKDGLDKLCHIEKLPGSYLGAKVHSVEEIMIQYVKESLLLQKDFDPAKDKIQIKVSGDGARMTRNSNYVLLSFSVLQTGESVMSSKGNRTVAVVNGSEDYLTLKECFGEVFTEINGLINRGTMDIGNTQVKTEYFLGGDYKFILMILGLKGATSNYACVWCKTHKCNRWEVDKPYEYYNSEPVCKLKR